MNAPSDSESDRCAQRVPSKPQVSEPIDLQLSHKGALALPAPGWRRLTGQSDHEAQDFGWRQMIHAADRSSLDSQVHSHALAEARSIRIFNTHTQTYETHHCYARRVLVSPFRAPTWWMRIVPRSATHSKRSSSPHHPLKTLIAHAPVPLAVIERGRVTFINQAALSCLGYRHENEVLHTSAMRYIPPSQRSAARQLMMKALHNARLTMPAEQSMLRADGTVFHAEVFLRKLNNTGQPAIQLAFNDISSRKRSEANRRLFRTFVEHTPAAIAMLNADLEYLLISQRWTEAFEVDANASQTRALIHTFPELDKSTEWQSIFHRALQGEVQSVAKQRLKHRDGGTRWIRWEIHPWNVDPDRGLIVFAEDMTANHQLEMQLQQAQRLESLGRLVSGLTHDFNNLLTTIKVNSSLARESMMNDTEAAASLEAIHLATEQSSSLIRQLLTFASKQEGKLREIDLATLVNDTKRLLGRSFSRHITIEERIESGLPTIYGEPNQLNQVLLNLAINAHDAMPQGGTLRFEVNERFKQESAAPQELETGPYLELRVQDTGTGIKAEDLPHIFDPFFTTKDAAHGTGLGLATCYGIIRRHGGAIRVSSELGKGTCFQLYLPVHTASSTRVSSKSERVARAQKTILVACAHDHVHYSTCRALRDATYLVVTAEDVSSICEQLRTYEGCIDLVISDLDPSHQDNQRCVEYLHQRNVALKLLLLQHQAPNPESDSSWNIADRILITPVQDTFLLHEVAMLIGIPPTHHLALNHASS